MPVWVRFAVFIVIILGVVSGLGYYVGWQVRRAFNPSRRLRVAYTLLFVSGPALVFGGRALDQRLGAAAELMASIGFVIVFGTVFAAALLAPLHLVTSVSERLRRRLVPSEPAAPAKRAEAPEAAPASTPTSDSEPALPARRLFVRQAAVTAALAGGVGCASHGNVFGRRDYVIEEVVIPVAGLSPRLSGYRIAQLSDIHFGQFVGAEERRKAVELVRRARPDLVVLTGDLVDNSAAHAPELGRLTRELTELHLRDGVVVVPGNPDYSTGIGVQLGAARAGGARVLVNQGVVIGERNSGFALLGVDDVWARRRNYGGRGPDLERAAAHVPADLPRILLCHNPEFFPRAAGKVALQLSGHTHGGQVNPGVTPADLVLPYVRGLYRENGSSLYVNRGFGTAGPPIRVAAPPEVTLVVLTAA